MQHERLHFLLPVVFLKTLYARYKNKIPTGRKAIYLFIYYQKTVGLHLANVLFDIKGKTFKIQRGSSAFASCD